MLLLESGLSGAQLITHPISLVAYVCALVTYYFVRKNVNDRKKLQANPAAYIATAERLNIDFGQIPERERAKVTLRTLSNRIIAQLITAIALIIAGLIIAYVSIVYIGKQAEAVRQQNEAAMAAAQAEHDMRKHEAEVMEQNRKDSIAATAKADSSRSKVAIQKNQVQLLIDRGKGIIERIAKGDNDAWDIDANFYDVKVIEVVEQIEKQRQSLTFRRELTERIMKEGAAGFPIKDKKSRTAYDSITTIQNLRHRVNFLEEFKSSL